MAVGRLHRRIAAPFDCLRMILFVIELTGSKSTTVPKGCSRRAAFERSTPSFGIVSASSMGHSTIHATNSECLCQIAIDGRSMY